MQPEETFDLLADAAGVRYPNPDRSNRGLCPAHGDQNNPALVFNIAHDSGNLVVYCHSQHCSLQSIADSIGVDQRAFFRGGGGGKFAAYVPIRWGEKPILELLKLIPFEYEGDTLHECVFRTLDMGIRYSTMPIGDVTKSEMLMLAGIWLEPMYDYDIHGDWWLSYDRLVSALYETNRETRIDPMAPVSAVPRRTA